MPALTICLIPFQASDTNCLMPFHTPVQSPLMAAITIRRTSWIKLIATDISVKISVQMLFATFRMSSPHFCQAACTSWINLCMTAWIVWMICEMVFLICSQIALTLFRKSSLLLYSATSAADSSANTAITARTGALIAVMAGISEAWINPTRPPRPVVICPIANMTLPTAISTGAL